MKGTRPTNHDIGVLYAATGDRHRIEAIASAKRCKHVMPHIPIAVWTDTGISELSFDIVILNRTPSYSYMDKVTAVSRTPFKRTLFLDSDTYICTDVSEMFDLLDRFEIVAAHASNRQSTQSTYLIKGVPDAFPEFNTGVLLYRNSQRIRRLFFDWNRHYERDQNHFRTVRHNAESRKSGLKPPGDQSSFREVLYNSNLQIGTLLPEYNFRFGYSAFAGSTVKILHGRDEDLGSLAAKINSETKRRAYVPGYGVLRPPPTELPPDAS